jgi:hypothetical protein
MRTTALMAALLAAFAAQSPPAMSQIAGLDLRVTDADIAPTVTIEEHENRRVERYSVNNNTYMLRITPANGSPYYLVDEDGSGEMAWRRGAAAPSDIPQWTLLAW